MAPKEALGFQLILGIHCYIYGAGHIFTKKYIKRGWLNSITSMGLRWGVTKKLID